MTQWIGPAFSLIAVAVQAALVWKWVRLRREVLETLAAAQEARDDAGRWLQEARGVFAHNTAMLREHGFLDEQPEKPTVQ